MYVFSTLYNESDTFLRLYLDNFLHFTGDDCFLVVNMPPGRPIPDHGVDLQGRIALINGTRRRQAFGHTLLTGHLEAFDAAQATWGHPPYFCPLASNCLFVRPFDAEATLASMRQGHRTPVDADIEFFPDVDIDNLPDEWWWPKLRENTEALAFLKTELGLQRLANNQIEGLFATGEDWALLHGRLGDIDRLGAMISQGTLIPLEECLPVSVFHQFGSGQHTNICHMFWARFRKGNGRATVRDLMGIATFPPHITCLKWFKRESYAVETNLITRPENRDMFAALLDAGPGADPLQMVGQRMMLEGLAAALRSREASPEARVWRPLLDHQVKTLTHEFAPEAGSHLVALVQDDETPGAASSIYCGMSSPDGRMRFAFQIAPADATHVRIRAQHDTGEASQSAQRQQASLFVSPMRGQGRYLFRLRTALPIDHATASALAELDAVVQTKTEGASEPVLRLKPLVCEHVAQNDGGLEYMFAYELLAPLTNIWFGVPFLLNTTLDVRLDYAFSALV